MRLFCIPTLVGTTFVAGSELRTEPLHLYSDKVIIGSFFHKVNGLGLFDAAFGCANKSICFINLEVDLRKRCNLLQIRCLLRLAAILAK